MKKTALRIGMTLQEFWYGNPQDYYIYLDAYIDKKEEERQEEDYKAWQHNIYTLKAVQQAMSTKNNAVYPKKPFYKAEKSQLSLEEQMYNRAMKEKKRR